MKRLAVALYITMGSSLASAAPEAWCNANSANCVCSDTFQSTNYTETVGGTVGAVYIGDQVGSKPCYYTSNGPKPRSVSWSYVNGNQFADNFVIRDQSSDGDSENALDKLPVGNTVSRFLRSFNHTAGAERFGYDDMPLAALASERIAMRWYSYHSTDYQWAWEGACTNGKILDSQAVDQGDPKIILTVINGSTGLYSFNNTLGWLWPGHSTFAGFDGGEGPRSGAGVSTYSYRGKWFRHEVVVERPRASSSGGYDFHYYVKNITDNTPEVEDVRFSAGCTSCGTGDATNFVWDSSIHPTQDLDCLHTEFYRAGTCNGWQGWVYMAIASWATNAGQRIGKATEVEGGGGPIDTTPPAAPRNVRVL